MLFSSIYAPTLLCVHHLAWTNGERNFHRFSISSLFNLAIYTINGPNKQTNEPTPPGKKTSTTMYQCTSKRIATACPFASR